MNLLQIEHNNIKIEDQILPKLDQLAKVLNIQSSGSVNLKFLIDFGASIGENLQSTKTTPICLLVLDQKIFKHENTFDGNTHISF